MRSRTAKTIFLKRNKQLRSTLTEPPTSEALVSTIPVHDSRARMLRNGIAITSFIYLEDYIKNRIGEIIHSIDNSSIEFSLFPQNFKEAMTLNALRSILYKATILKKDDEDWLTFIQDESQRVASSKSQNFKLSKYSIGWDKPNVSLKEVQKTLKIFNVEGGWETIMKITEKSETVLVNPAAIFRNAALRRHAAAHDPNSESLLSDLIQFSKDSVTIAMAIDVLLTTSLSKINSAIEEYVSGQKKINHENINFRFIVEVDKYWKEYRITSNRAVKRSNDIQEAINSAKDRAVRREEILLVKDASNQILNWETTALN